MDVDIDLAANMSDFGMAVPEWEDTHCSSLRTGNHGITIKTYSLQVVAQKHLEILASAL